MIAELLLTETRETVADAIADMYGLVILRPDDYDAQKVVSYLYLWVNWTRLEAQTPPYLYIGSRRFDGDPSTDNYRGSNVDLNHDQDKGDDFDRYIIATFESDPGKEAYQLEEVILWDIDAAGSAEFYNLRNDADGFTSDGARLLNEKTWFGPGNEERRAKMSALKKAAHADPNSAYNSDEYKAKKSAAQKEEMSRPERRAKHLAAMKALYADPNSAYNSDEYKAKHSAALKEAMNRPETKAKVSAGAKESWQDKKIAAARNRTFKDDPFIQAHIRYYPEFIERAETGDFERCDDCDAAIIVEPTRKDGRVICFDCNPL